MRTGLLALVLLAAAGSVKESFPGLDVASEQLLDRVHLRNARGLQRFRGASVQERRDFPDLIVAHEHRRHAFVGPTIANDLADEIALYVMSHERRTHQVRASRSRGIRAMAESTRLLKAFAPTFNGRSWSLRRSLRPHRGNRATGQKNRRNPHNQTINHAPSPSSPILEHRPSSTRRILYSF